MKFIQGIIIIVLLFIVSQSGVAQEMLTGLQQNGLIRQVYQLGNPNNRLNDNPLTIPFRDDFSAFNVYPDAQLWLDQNIFVNKDFPINPPNTGAATFDVIDATGSVYTHATVTPFIADYLTSRKIRLDSVFYPVNEKITPADSLYFSFFYQIQGRGDRPEKFDSLILQFGYPSGKLVFDFIDSVTLPVDTYLLLNQIDTIFPNDTLFAPEGCNQELYYVADRLMTWGDDVTVPCDTVLKPEILWRNVWSVSGVFLTDTIIPRNDVFNQILIPITDTLYFVSDFQFRFFNYGSIASTINPGNRGNVDQWNVDYVYLNKGRSKSDSTYNVVSFSNRAPSFLKRYESMPYKQYRSNPTNAVRPEFEINITNLDNVTHQTHYWYEVTQRNGSQNFVYDGGSCELLPYDLGGFQSCSSSCGAAQACPVVNSLFALQAGIDSTSFVIKHFVSDSTDGNTLVDSLIYQQGFYNYFAYDDGTPELGYGLEPAGAYVAVQYNMTVPDTLQGVQLFFNKTLNNANYKYFDIVVWGDNNGKPGSVLYRKERQHPLWSNDMYGYMMYSFVDPPIVSGIFYVGLYQSEMGSLNIGYDAVSNSSDYTFYKITDQWSESQFTGSLMIRPVVGSEVFIGSSEHYMGSDPSLMIAPNPASANVSISLADSHDFLPQTICIYDLSGRMIINKYFTADLDVSFLESGIYFLQISGENRRTITSRLMIAR
jgi:hypothetical protein